MVISTLTTAWRSRDRARLSTRNSQPHGQAEHQERDTAGLAECPQTTAARFRSRRRRSARRSRSAHSRRAGQARMRHQQRHEQGQHAPQLVAGDRDLGQPTPARSGRSFSAVSEQGVRADRMRTSRCLQRASRLADIACRVLLESSRRRARGRRRSRPPPGPARRRCCGSSNGTREAARRRARRPSPDAAGLL